MIRISEYHDIKANLLLLPNEKEFSCPMCSKPIRFRSRSPYLCPACAEPQADISSLMEDPETRMAYHRFGEVAIIHADVLYYAPR